MVDHAVAQHIVEQRAEAAEGYESANDTTERGPKCYFEKTGFAARAHPRNQEGDRKPGQKK